ncbi:unnamed protein product, partial [Rangifer tarandus platyrhynchus]
LGSRQTVQARGRPARGQGGFHTDGQGGCPSRRPGAQLVCVCVSGRLCMHASESMCVCLCVSRCVLVVLMVVMVMVVVMVVMMV